MSNKNVIKEFFLSEKKSSCVDINFLVKCITISVLSLGTRNLLSTSIFSPSDL